MKTVVVLSSMVDSTIREYQPDVHFILFRTLEELGDYITFTPIRAEQLFLTREVLPQVNTSLNYLGELLQNPFLNVDKVVYISEKQSRELASVRYFIDTKELSNWEIVEGFLTREYVSGIINGTLRTDNVGTKRKAVYRVPREAYVREKLKNKPDLNEKYISDEEDLADIPDEQPPVWVPPEVVEEGEIIHIVGEAIEERYLFAFLTAQYLSLTGKTFIMESDEDYHQLTEYVTKSGVDYLHVEIEDLLNDTVKVLTQIKRSPKSLVCVLSKARVKYSYTFLYNLIYNNLTDTFRYFIREDSFSEVPSMTSYLVVTRCTIPGILSACEKLDPSMIAYATFVGIIMQKIEEVQVKSSEQLTMIVDDVLNAHKIPSVIFSVNSLRINGYDLGSVLRR